VQNGLYKKGISMKKKTQSKTLTPKITKERFELALIDSWGNIELIAKRLKVSRMSVYRYIKENPELQTKINEERANLIESAENVLADKIIKEKNLIATIFLLKTRGKHLGYSEKQSIDVSSMITKITFIEDLED